LTEDRQPACGSGPAGAGGKDKIKNMVYHIKIIVQRLNILNCKDIVNKISETLLDKFTADDFILKNNIFEKTISSSKKYQYIIDVKKVHGGYSLHLILKLSNKDISKGVNAILKKTLVDKKIEYPINWTQKDIDNTIQIRTKNNIVAMLTDWRIFKQDNESLEEFNKKFSIWFCVFDEIEEKEKWKEQLYKSIELSKKWFEMVDNEEYIIEHTIYESLYLLKINNRIDFLNKKFQEYKTKNINEEELEIFYKYLME
jgi:hypothetical protein